MTQYDSLVFSAAGAFVCLPRPGREDAERLDALAIPLFEKLSVEGKRRIAAVLSECRTIMPQQLIEALVLQPLDVSASLLISRAEISDTILEKAIAQGGEPYARVISLRHNISQSIKTRIDDFIESIIPMTADEAKEYDRKMQQSKKLEPRTKAQTELEMAQDRLRTMMMRKTVPETKATLAPFANAGDINIVARFINLALEGDADFLSTALADEWSASFPTVRPLVQRNGLHNLAILLKGLEFGATDTFAIVSAFNPQAFASRQAIASFYLKFQAIDDVAIHALTQGFGQNSGASASEITNRDLNAA
jgi:uncharacterized protein (DUF2336 family)